MVSQVTKAVAWFQPQPIVRAHRLRGYGNAVLVVAAALLVKLFVFYILGIHTYFVLFSLAICFSALFCGVGPGILATALAALAGTMLFQATKTTLSVPAQAVFQAVFYGMEGLLLTSLCAFARKGQLAAARQREGLELRVAERTASLATSNQRLEAEVGMRQSAQDALERQKRQLHLIADSLPVVVAELDAEERFRFVNDRATAWYRTCREEIVGRPMHDVIGEERYQAVAANVKLVLSGAAVTFEQTVAAGSERPVFSVAFMPERDSTGAVCGFVLLATDITKHKAAEEELRRAKEASDVANRTKTVFLANMSHEIRTPLGAVLGFSDLLVDPMQSAAEKDRYVDAIRRNGKLLLSIINDVLDLSKVEVGKLQIDRADVDLGELLDDVTMLLNFQATEKGIAFSVSQATNVPQRIQTDPMRLRQMLINIAGNAIKFTSHGSVSVRASMIKDPASDGSERLAFAVTDTGTGIPADRAQQLFEPFSQLDPSSTRKFGGAGLGLALSKRLAHLLGGDITLASSTPGQGSTFLITVDPGPCQSLAQRPALHRRADGDAGFGSQPSPAPRLDGLAVLLVEDGFDNQVLFNRLLTRAGAKVETAGDGKRGIEMALAAPYDVILMDLQMPIMDGYEATKELRARGYQRPILALTAHALSGERERTLAEGFDGHLSKPIDRHLLVSKLSQFVPVTPALTSQQTRNFGPLDAHP